MVGTAVKAAIAGIAISLSVGCVGPDGSRATGGAATGAILGGLAGSQIGSGSGRTAAIVGGALLGGLLGNQIGAQLDERDRQLAAQANQAALDRSREYSWKNPNTGNEGVITPGAYVSENCREYTNRVMIGREWKTVHGTACKTEAGWKVKE